MYEIPYNKSIMKEWRDFGFKRGQQSCAAGPWIYRTDTGDETGKVVESAELPKGKDDTWFLMLYGFDDQCMGLATINDIEKQPKWFRLHCKAYAEIRKG